MLRPSLLSLVGVTLLVATSCDGAIQINPPSAATFFTGRSPLWSVVAIVRGGGGRSSLPSDVKKNSETSPPVTSTTVHDKVQNTLCTRTTNLIRVALESAMYGSIYAVLALLCAGWVELVFPRYDSAKTYTMMDLFWQVAAQAGANCAMAQAARDVVKRLPLPDIDGSDKALAAAGGGVIFGFLMFTRQANWKAKVVALDALLDKTWLFP